jgi:hypothetical protein
MKRSEKLRRLIGCEAPDLDFKALGLYSGMFYIDRDDPSGWFLRPHVCGMSKEDIEFQKNTSFRNATKF